MPPLGKLTIFSIVATTKWGAQDTSEMNLCIMQPTHLCSSTLFSTIHHIKPVSL